MMQDDLPTMPLVHHLTELRKRIFICLIAFVIGFGLCFYAADFIFGFLLIPLQKALGNDLTVSYWAPHEAFFTYMRLSIYGGLFMTFPVLLTQIWGFIMPALYINEQRIFRPFLWAIPLMFAFGCVICFYYVMPTALHFFANFQTDLNLEGAKIIQETRISDYASFALNFLLIFGLAFELPVILVLLGCLGIISAAFLRENRRYAILLIALFAAIATPPDALSMIFMGTALSVLYECSILLVAYFQKKSNPPEVL